MEQWLKASGITQGPIFRRLYRDNRLAENSLTSLSVSNILKKYAKAVQLDRAENYSSHSLRRGLATAASRDGASLASIMRQGRWRNVNTVMEYIEAAQRCEENAAKSVIKKLADNYSTNPEILLSKRRIRSEGE